MPETPETTESDEPAPVPVPYRILETGDREQREAAGELRLLLKPGHIQNYRDAARKIWEDAAEDDADEEFQQFGCRTCGSHGYDLDEHEFMQGGVPHLTNALEYLQDLIQRGRQFVTPNGLLVVNASAISWSRQKMGGLEIWQVHDPKGIKNHGTPFRFLRGGPRILKDLPIEWLNVDPQEYDARIKDSYFYGGFWQAWTTALRAEYENLSLPLDGEGAILNTETKEKPEHGYE